MLFLRYGRSRSGLRCRSLTEPVSDQHQSDIRKRGEVKRWRSAIRTPGRMARSRIENIDKRLQGVAVGTGKAHRQRSRSSSSIIAHGEGAFWGGFAEYALRRETSMMVLLQALLIDRRLMDVPASDSEARGRFHRPVLVVVDHRLDDVAGSPVGIDSRIDDERPPGIPWQH